MSRDQFWGYDIGSRNIKLAIMGRNGDILFADYLDTGVNPSEAVDALSRKALQNPLVARGEAVMAYATGYGRKLLVCDKTVSEISCHALGVRSFLPSVHTILDIGGQDCKAISLSPEGQVLDFVMNDKCAAGTGRFLEMVALRLGIGCHELGALAAGSGHNIRLSSTCVVFAESEITGLIAVGASPADIVRAVHISISERIVSQLNQLKWQTPVVFTGGVALNQDLKDIMAQILKTELLIPPDPELTGALGAAIMARRDHEKRLSHSH